jgi:hypothetical protein
MAGTAAIFNGRYSCYLYWKVMNHAMYTTRTRRGNSSMCFLKELWHIKEKLAMEENIPNTDSLTVLLCVNSDGSDKQVPIVIRKSSKPKCFMDVKKLPIKYYHANSKAWMTTEFFCLFLHSLDTQMGGAKKKVKVKAFFYAHSVTDADHENILSLEKSYFQLRQN